MQIYPTYHLLRAHFSRVLASILLLFCFFSLIEVNAKGRSYVDSIYYTFNKKERLSKLLVLPIDDFSKKDDLSWSRHLIMSKSIGGVLVNKGEKDSIHKWISDMKIEPFPIRPFFAMNMSNVFESSVSGMRELPAWEQVELISDSDLLVEVGSYMGTELDGLGIDLLFLESQHVSFPGIQALIKGIEGAGIGVRFINNHDNKPEELTIWNPEYKNGDPVEICFKHLEANADMIILPQKVEHSSTLLSKLFDSKAPKKKILKKKGKKVILFKDELKEISMTKVNYQKNDSEVLMDQVSIASVVLLKNGDDILPVKDLDRHSMAVISGNAPLDLSFRNYINQYDYVAEYDFGFFDDNKEKAINTLQHFDVVLVSLASEDHTLNDQLRETLLDIGERSKIVIFYQGDKNHLSELKDFNTIIWAPIANEYYARIMPQSFFGANAITGSVHDLNQAQITNSGINVPELGRLKFGPTETAFDRRVLYNIDILVKDAIESKVFPGCQVFMAKDGNVIYNRAFGHLTYDSLIQVERSTIYDIASLTKVIAMVPAMMFLSDWNKLEIEDTLGQHAPVFVGSDKSGLSLEKIMTHQSGFKSYLPFWRNAEFDASADDFKFKLPRRRRYKYGSQFIDWNDSIQYWISTSKFNKLKNDDGTYRYLYSDLGFMALYHMAELKLNQPIDEFLGQHLYAPLGMNSTAYRPLCYFPYDRIAPTEEDNHLRNSLVWGKVHDRNAALMGGVSGHAGLFSTATDLGKFMQMMLQNGYYGGKQYFSNQNVERFVSQPEDSNRRALGWDKTNKEVSNSSNYTSELAFGHSGFTGTIAWADPEHDLVYVFLSNRVYPDAENNKLIQSNIRTRIHDILYESFLGSKTVND